MAKKFRRNGMESLSDYKVQLSFPVRWGEMDAFQHVNNTVYLKWIEHARVEYLTTINGSLTQQEMGPILARLDCIYIHPIHFPDTVTVGFRTTEIMDDRLICEGRIFSGKHQKLCAISHNTIMAYNFKKQIKDEIPEVWKAKIMELDEI